MATVDILASDTGGPSFSIGRKKIVVHLKVSLHIYEGGELREDVS